jgi:HAD superfamily hydrolase (TIGR01509 family)
VTSETTSETTSERTSEATSETARTEPVTDGTEEVPSALRDLIARTRVVLWDFDGPVCRLFAGHSAQRVAGDLVAWLEGRGLHGLLTAAERECPDPHVVLRAVDRRHPGSELVAELEEHLTREELRAASSAMPTPYADPLIRTWRARGCRLAITTNNSPLAVHGYLLGRGLTSCFAPHVYGRTRNLQLMKPDPDCLDRALRAMDAAPSTALMIGDTPTDHEAARRAGVPFLGYARNQRKEALLRDAGAALVVSSLEPVLTLVRKPVT